MLSQLRRIFDDAVAQASGTHDGDAGEQAVRRAAAALMVEMGRADHHVAPQEQARIEYALGQVFGLDAEEVQALSHDGESQVDAATSLYEFTSIINQRFSHERKVQLVDELWRIAYADGELDKHEAHLVRKVAGLLHLRHREYIGGKLKAEGGP